MPCSPKFEMLSETEILSTETSEFSQKNKFKFHVLNTLNRGIHMIINMKFHEFLALKVQCKSR